MNERIKELERQAEKFVMSIPASLDINEYTSVFNEKFAELIVRECLNMCDEVHRDYGMASDTARISKRYIKEHFGVEE